MLALLLYPDEDILSIDLVADMSKLGNNLLQK